jgi:hypothetical protein
MDKKIVDTLMHMVKSYGDARQSRGELRKADALYESIKFTLEGHAREDARVRDTVKMLAARFDLTATDLTDGHDLNATGDRIL